MPHSVVSDQRLHCLLRPVCPSTKDKYSRLYIKEVSRLTISSFSMKPLCWCWHHLIEVEAIPVSTDPYIFAKWINKKNVNSNTFWFIISVI